jgi:hypothetical protein
VILGPRFKKEAQTILDTHQQKPVEKEASHPVSASPLREGVVLRFAGNGAESVGVLIQEALNFIPTFLGENPWTRKW